MSYIPNTVQDKAQLLSSLGLASAEDLFKDIPAKTRLQKDLDLPSPLSEAQLLEEVERQSQRNATGKNFLGGGSYRHFIPSALKHLVRRAEFYTAYTPYQAEASQGTLQAIFEYQSLICRLTGMDAANASMYDGATAMAEAALLACRHTGRKLILVSSAVHPEYRQVLRTYAKAADMAVEELPFGEDGRSLYKRPDGASLPACLILQQPNFFGCIEEAETLERSIHKSGGLFIVSVDPISLGLLKAPGEYGADLVVGEGQSLGMAPSFGGPGLGIFAVKQELLRLMPGRIAGETADKDGKRGYCLTLQTREQHIRREKAGSNICSNEALCALSACVYLTLLGKNGLKKVAELCLQKSHYLADRLKLKFPKTPFFKEFVVSGGAGLDLKKYYPDLSGNSLICATELYSKSDLDAFPINIL